MSGKVCACGRNTPYTDWTECESCMSMRAARAELDRLRELVERLTAAGDAMAYKLEVEEGCGQDHVDEWQKAKGEGR